jgi:hypothetical protein
MRHAAFAALGILALAVTASAAPKPAAPAKPKEAWASGKVGSVDASARTIVIKQGTHEMTFSLTPDATLMQGHTTIQAADLAGDVGKPVKVRYTLSGTTKLADRVEIPAPPAAKAPATTSTKKPAK